MQTITNNTSIVDNVRQSAEEAYLSGTYHCATAVVHAIKKYFAPDMPTSILDGAAGFGTGVGGAKCMCGAVSGAVIALGYFFGRTFPTTITDPQSQKTLLLAYQLQEQFKERNKFMCCTVHLRTQGNAKCHTFVGDMAALAAELILEHKGKAPSITKAPVLPIKTGIKVDVQKIQYDSEEVFRIGGFYCSEAIVSAIRKNIAPQMPQELIACASGFPIGVGRSKCMCGAISGGILALGYFFGNNPDKIAELSKELHTSFKRAHKDSACCHVHVKGMDLQSGEHKKQCVAFTGEMAKKTAEIIARELES